jgi:tripartite-type tricarboxylate transporter receptor subunit TctC
MLCKRHRLKAGLLTLLSAVIFVAAASALHAQPAKSSYPNRAVRLVVGFAPGGGNDIIARLLADKLAKSLGQPVIVENKPGAGGGVAASFVKSQPADGYTLLIGASGAMVVGPAIGTPATFDTLTDFDPISILGTFPLVALVSADSPHKTLADLVAWSKANPASANYASSSPTFTLATELLKLKTGATLQRVSYRGSNDSVLAVLGNQVTAAMVDPLPAMPLVRDGKLRALAVTSSQRLPELPDVPTMAEAGISGVVAEFWSGLFAPKNTPPDILAVVQEQVRLAMQEADVRDRLRALATDATSSTPAAFSERITSDLKAWRDVAKAANVTAE